VPHERSYRTAVKLVQRAVDTAGLVIGRGTLPARPVYATRPCSTAIVLVRSLIYCKPALDLDKR